MWIEHRKILHNYKSKVHRKLDERFGISKYSNRNKYLWLQKYAPKNHVAQMDIDECKETLELLNNYTYKIK